MWVSGIPQSIFFRCLNLLSLLCFDKSRCLDRAGLGPHSRLPKSLKP